MKPILFHNADSNYQLRQKNLVRKWVVECICLEKKTLDSISYVFCTDDYLLEINQNHLNHDTYTDIITFDYSEGDLISSEIYISVDRVKENSKSFTHSFTDEMHRVIIHGVLHLIGYKDKTESEAQTMRGKEDYYLSLRQF